MSDHEVRLMQLFLLIIIAIELIGSWLMVAGRQVEAILLPMPLLPLALLLGHPVVFVATYAASKSNASLSKGCNRLLLASVVSAWLAVASSFAELVR